MAYLYHSVPEGLRGTTLYPLNRLKDVYPEAYAFQARKYVGREHRMEQRIEPLGCLWNDVIFLIPVHPTLIKESLARRGHEFSRTRWYEIDPALIDPRNAAIWRRLNREQAEYMPFSREALEGMTALPEIAERYFDKVVQPGQPVPFVFQYVPHVLYKGTLDVNALREFEA